jgi:hypothetical protein
MKKYVLGLVTAIAVITSAFTVKAIVKETKAKKAGLYWFVGTTYTGRQNTHAAEVPLSGCPDMGALHCEDGYDDNDFNTPGVPTSGLKSGATINDVIRKVQ